MNSPLDQRVANDLWLHAQHARQLTQDAIAASTSTDALIRSALETGCDADTIADASFTDVALILHIAAGGTTAEYLLARSGTTADV